MPLVLVMLGCGGATMPQLPSRGGAAWVEVQSKNFTVWTNSSTKRGHELVRAMEERRQVISRAMNRTEQKERIFVVALQNEREMAAFRPSMVTAFAWPNSNPSSAPGIALPANLSEEGELVMNHELAHAISYAIIPYQPRWLAEGLAGYFEMGTLDPDTRTATIGAPRPELLMVLRRHGPQSARELFSCDEKYCTGEDFYVSSWALFSYLLNEHFEQFNEYLRQLTEHEGDHKKAWSAAFPDLTVAKIDRELPGWSYAGSFAMPRIKVEVQRYPTVDRPLVDTDVLSARSLLNFLVGRDPASLADAEAAIAIDPTHPLAWSLARAQNRQMSMEQARAVVKAHPKDWRAWQVLLFRLRKEEGDHAAEEKKLRDHMCMLAVRDGQTCGKQ